MILLAIGAHPDDIEFGCGGVLIKEVQQGHEVHVLCLTKGEAGTAGTPEQREKETKQAAKIMGVQLDFLDVGGDCNVEYTLPNRLAIAKKIREIRPDIVLSPTLDDNQHPDHRITAELTRDACRLARYGGIEKLKKLKPHLISSLYQYQITRFTAQQPDLIVDVSSVMEQWIKAMRAHDSQVSNMNYVNFIQARSSLWGQMSGREYGIALWQLDPIVIDNLETVKKAARRF